MKIDESISHYNENRGDGPELDRMKLGKQIFTDISERTIQNRLSQWQKGNYETRPTLEQLDKISTLLNVSIDYLIGNTLNPNRK